MRETQVVGLSAEARCWLDKHCKHKSRCKCTRCGHEHGGGLVKNVYDTETGRQEGMFNDGPDLYQYTTLEGNEVFEVVQAVPWSGGPCIFLCLATADGQQFAEWSREELAKA